MSEGTQPNNQPLPPGIQERAAAAATNPSPQYQPPSQALPEHQYQQPVNPQAQQSQEPAPVNPMLSRFSQEQQAPQVPTQHLQAQAPQKPAEAPQEPPKAEDKPKPSGADTSIQDLVGDLSEDTYAKPSITYIENVCKGSDVDLGRAFNKAVEHGDASLIDEAYLREKLGENADAVIQQATSLFEYSTHKAQEALSAVYEAAGGQEVLEQASKFFNASADPAEKAEIMYLLDSGNKDLMTRAAQRIVQFAQQGGMTYQRGKQPIGNPSTAKGLSKAEYIAEIQKPNISPERYEELRNLRKLGMSQGL